MLLRVRLFMIEPSHGGFVTLKDVGLGFGWEWPIKVMCGYAVVGLRG